MKGITIGQYYPADSVLHRLDARVKFVGTLIYIVSLFLVNGWGYLICTGFLITMILLSKVPVKYMIKGLRAIFVIMIITVVFNLFLTPGEEIVRFGIFKITYEGISVAVFMAIRLVYLVIGASLMTLTTTPNALTDGMEKLFAPLSKIRVPVHEIAMMMSIALRFIPILSEETDKIMKAQMARGADLDSKNILKKAKSMVPILVPLFVSAFRRASDLATAMEARCYRGAQGRTRMKPLRYCPGDYKAYAVVLVYLGVVILTRVLWGW